MQKQWRPWQLAPDSDPRERWILVSEDGSEEHPNGVLYETEEDVLRAADLLNEVATIPPLHEVLMADVEQVRPPWTWHALVGPAAAILFWILFFTFCILAGTRHWKR